MQRHGKRFYEKGMQDIADVSTLRASTPEEIRAYAVIKDMEFEVI